MAFHRVHQQSRPRNFCTFHPSYQKPLFTHVPEHPHELGFLILSLVFGIEVLSAQNAGVLSSDDKKAAVKRIGTLLVDRYVFEDVAKQCAGHLRTKFVEGAFDQITTTAEFATALTTELQRISRDKHMRVSVGVETEKIVKGEGLP